MSESLLIRGGHVIDPAQKIDESRDVLLKDGRVVEIAAPGQIKGGDVTFDAKRKRCHIEQKHILHLALDDGPLNGSSHRHALHGVNASLNLLAKVFLDKLLHDWHARGTAHQNDLGDFRNRTPRMLGVLPRIVNRPVDRAFAAVNNQLHDPFELGAREFLR